MLLCFQRPRLRVTRARTASPGGTNDRGKSPSGDKEYPCWYHFKAGKGCVKGSECSKKTEHKLETMPKGIGKGKSKSTSSSPKKEDGLCYAFQEGKCENCNA